MYLSKDLGYTDICLDADTVKLDKLIPFSYYNAIFTKAAKFNAI